MSELRIGSLFSGAGGLDMAVETVFGGQVAWHCENDLAASRVLAAHWPGVPNLGDITQVDWAQVGPVDVLCGGFPCQDVSAAGRRAGIRSDTRSGLWAMYADAIDALRPPLVIVENVRGLLNAEAHRNLEPTDPTVGDGADGPVLRAAGAVLGDLADLGYDARWATVPASAVGAPHKRERVFILAYASGDGRHERRPEPARIVRGSDAAVSSDGPVDLLPTPWSSDCFGPGQHGDGGLDLRTAVVENATQWGKYESAIRRWENLTRPAPPPTESNTRGNPRLAAAFSEWLMGWPAGWVTDIDISRNDQLRIIGNGVVPQQAAAALWWLLTGARDNEERPA